MRRIVSTVLAVFYLWILVSCVRSFISLGFVRNFGIIWVLPAIVLFVCHIIILSKRKSSVIFGAIVAVCDFWFGISPFAILGMLAFSPPKMFIGFAIPIIGSILSGIFIIIKSKKYLE